MKGIVRSAAVAVVAAQALVAGQGRDVNQVLAEVRSALGGDKIASLRTLVGEGRASRTGPGGQTVESEFEVAMELPDKYRLRTAIAPMGNMTIYRHTGFNGGDLIEEIDRPPNLAGGNVVIRIGGPGGSVLDPQKMTPEQKAEADRARLLAAKREFARLTLGLFANSPAAYPLTFSYVGRAESADGEAEVIGVSGEGGFEARLFVDAATHLPLMLTWMDREPIVIQAGRGGATVAAGGGGTAMIRSIDGTAGPGGGRSGRLSAEEMEKLQKEVEAKRAEAEATRRTVEFRVYYADYRPVGGVKLPHRIQRAIDGKTTEEMVFDTVKVNSKIDAGKFKPTK